MENLQDILKKVKEINDPLKKGLLFLGILTDLIGQKFPKPIVVGGFALEFYSTGGYATGDIDLVFPDSVIIGEKLEFLGFQRIGRHWISQEYDLFIEIPGSSLKNDEEKRVSTIEIEGFKVYIIGVEDLILDRLNAFVHWKSTDDGYWAKELLFIYSEKIDMEYLKKRSIEEKTKDALHSLLKEIEEINK